MLIWKLFVKSLWDVDEKRVAHVIRDATVHPARGNVVIVNQFDALLT